MNPPPSRHPPALPPLAPPMEGDKQAARWCDTPGALAGRPSSKAEGRRARHRLPSCTPQHTPVDTCQRPDRHVPPPLLHNPPSPGAPLRDSPPCTIGRTCTCGRDRAGRRRGRERRGGDRRNASDTVPSPVSPSPLARHRQTRGGGAASGGEEAQGAAGISPPPPHLAPHPPAMNDTGPAMGRALSCVVRGGAEGRLT